MSKLVFPSAEQLQEMAPDDLTRLIQSIDQEKNRLDRELAVNESQRQNAEAEFKKYEAELHRIVGATDDASVQAYIKKCATDAGEALDKLRQLYEEPEQQPERIVKHG
ncbi:MAG: hypothetical protein EHJ95_07555 [Methanobacteriota archaeon]|nr:MAG: hypothetical protein EHJ95_07555 [Euryarchaeota archaeon]